MSKQGLALALLLALGACGSGSRESAVDAAPPDAGPPADGRTSEPGEVPPSAQRDGDPQAGYMRLVNEGYVSCGLPWSLYAQFFGPAPEAERLPGREGMNQTLPYAMTAFQTASGVEVVSANCLACHAGHLNGQLIVGLGASDGDFTVDQVSALELAGGLISDPAENAEWRKFTDRMEAIGPYTLMSTVGPNPADNLALALFAHRDPATLAWSNMPLMGLPPEIVIPVDVPPWWRMAKKNAMFYTGAGRGDQARIMMSASALCTDTVDEARAIDSYFPDVRAFIRSLVPPAWPYPVDADKAAAGKDLFVAHCASCHGTYDADPKLETYPNLVVALDEVGTDPTLAVGSGSLAGPYVNWFNASFYGEVSYLAPAPGYYAPPLDGIWATAPYLHNGSVPTLAALLDTSSRPASWTRTFDDSDYDPDAVGWHFTALDHGQDAEPDTQKRKLIYDTSKLGYGNGGHAFGDTLSEDERGQLLEYLKTL